MMVHKLNSSTWEEEEKRVLGIQGYFLCQRMLIAFLLPEVMNE